MSVAADTVVADSATDIGSHGNPHALLKIFDTAAGTGDDPAALVSENHGGCLRDTLISIVVHAHVGSANKGSFDLNQNFSGIDLRHIGFTNPEILFTV